MPRDNTSQTTDSKTPTMPFAAQRFCVAPMLDVTDRHARYIYRNLSQHCLLYTEMITTGAIIHGDAQRFLAYDPSEHPVALQLGGSDPKALAECTKLANKMGYDEINLNVGCPSDRVQAGCFGASLMAEPQLVRDCINAMQDVSTVPVTVKCRLGIDEQEDYTVLLDFIDRVTSAPCQDFIIHARKAWLKGLSPKQNRDIPPLRYDWVYKIKQQRPELNIIINGGIKTLADCQQHLEHVDGVMLGREIQHNPLLLAQVDEKIFNQNQKARSTEEILLSLLPYIEEQLILGTPLQHISRHLVTLYQGVPGAKKFRRHLSENAYKDGAGTEVIVHAIALVNEQQAFALENKT